ncbi:MAG: phage minor head protein [Bergeyella sp.]
MKVNESTGNIAPEVIKMQQNIFRFSGAKNVTVLEEINKILQKQLPWEQFKNEVLKLNPKYNKNYLQAEWQTANQSAKHARDWEYFKANADQYPNLVYRTRGDNKVRDAHVQLNGIVAPLESDFWKIHYPQNGWRCRCYAVQTAETPTAQDKIPILSEKDFPKEFRGNVGISGQIFSESEINGAKAHPYFALAKNDTWKKSVESSKRAAPGNIVYKNDKNTLKVSPFADEKDLKDNIADARTLIDNHKIDIQIRAHLDGRILKDFKNPEYIINGKIGDRKAPISLDYSKTLSKANKQGCEVIVFNISKNGDTMENAIEKIEKLLGYRGVHSNIKEFYIIDKTGKSKHIIRKKAD